MLPSIVAASWNAKHEDLAGALLLLILQDVSIHGVQAEIFHFLQSLGRSLKPAELAVLRVPFRVTCREQAAFLYDVSHRRDLAADPCEAVDTLQGRCCSLLRRMASTPAFGVSRDTLQRLVFSSTFEEDSQVTIGEALFSECVRSYEIDRAVCVGPLLDFYDRFDDRLGFNRLVLRLVLSAENDLLWQENAALKERIAETQKHSNEMQSLLRRNGLACEAPLNAAAAVFIPEQKRREEEVRRAQAIAAFQEESRRQEKHLQEEVAAIEDARALCAEASDVKQRLSAAEFYLNALNAYERTCYMIRRGRVYEGFHGDKQRASAQVKEALLACDAEQLRLAEERSMAHEEMEQRRVLQSIVVMHYKRGLNMDVPRFCEGGCCFVAYQERVLGVLRRNFSFFHEHAHFCRKMGAKVHPRFRADKERFLEIIAGEEMLLEDHLSKRAEAAVTDGGVPARKKNRKKKASAQDITVEACEARAGGRWDEGDFPKKCFELLVRLLSVPDELDPVDRAIATMLATLTPSNPAFVEALCKCLEAKEKSAADLEFLRGAMEVALKPMQAGERAAYEKRVTQLPFDVLTGIVCIDTSTFVPATDLPGIAPFLNGYRHFRARGGAPRHEVTLIVHSLAIASILAYQTKPTDFPTTVLIELLDILFGEDPVAVAQCTAPFLCQCERTEKVWAFGHIIDLFAKALRAEGTLQRMNELRLIPPLLIRLEKLLEELQMVPERSFSEVAGMHGSVLDILDMVWKPPGFKYYMDLGSMSAYGALLRLPGKNLIGGTIECLPLLAQRQLLIPLKRKTVHERKKTLEEVDLEIERYALDYFRPEDLNDCIDRFCIVGDKFLHFLTSSAEKWALDDIDVTNMIIHLAEYDFDEKSHHSARLMYNALFKGAAKLGEQMVAVLKDDPRLRVQTDPCFVTYRNSPLQMLWFRKMKPPSNPGILSIDFLKGALSTEPLEDAVAIAADYSSYLTEELHRRVANRALRDAAYQMSSVPFLRWLTGLRDTRVQNMVWTTAVTRGALPAALDVWRELDEEDAFKEGLWLVFLLTLPDLNAFVDATELSSKHLAYWAKAADTWVTGQLTLPEVHWDFFETARLLVTRPDEKQIIDTGVVLSTAMTTLAQKPALQEAVWAVVLDVACRVGKLHKWIPVLLNDCLRADQSDITQALLRALKPALLALEDGGEEAADCCIAMQELFPCIVRISRTSLPVYRAAPDTWLTFLDLLILVEKYNISFELWTAIVELAAMKEWDASIYRTFVRHVCDLLVKVDHEKIATFRPEVAQLMVVMGGYGSHLEKNGEDTSDLCRGIVAAMKEIMGVRCAGATTVHVCVRLAAKPLSVLAYQTPDPD